MKIVSPGKRSRALFCSLFLILALGCSRGGSSSGAAPAANLFVGDFEVRSVEAQEGGLVTVAFTHPVDTRFAEDMSQFEIDGLPILGSRRGVDSRIVILETDYQLPQGYEVTIFQMENARGEDLTGSRTIAFQGKGDPILEQFLPGDDLPTLASRGWQVVDDPQATVSAPSRWSVSGGVVSQQSNIYGGSGDSIPVVERYGTYFLWGGKSITNGWIEATLSNNDDDAMGLILRYQDPDNYLRFEWEKQRRRRRLVEVLNGQSTELAFDNEPFVEGQDYQVRFVAWNNRVGVFINQKLILGARLGSTAAAGRAGLFCWGSDAFTAKNLRIQEPSQALQQPNAPFPQRPDAPLSTHGVGSSGLTHNSAQLWVRASEDAMVSFELSTEPRFLQPISFPPMNVTRDTDFTVIREVDQLLPQTRYYYRAMLASPGDPSRRNSSEVGTFMTFAEPQKPQDVVFGFAADFHGAVPSRFPILDNLVARQPDFVMTIGDFPYTDSSPSARTLDGYRSKHRRIRSYDPIKNLFVNVPIFATWDDHEVKNNWDGGTDPNRVQLGMKVWKEYFPYRKTPGSGEGIYRSFKVGSSVEIFMLDTRSFRPRNSVTDNASKSMLGTTQKQWFLAALKASTARYKFVVSSVPLRYGSTATDHWKGYTTERTEIFDFINAHNISRVTFLAGDQHWAAVHKHPEGVLEVQTGPISVGLRTPPSSMPAEIVYRRAIHSYGLVRVDATAGLCFIELYDASDRLLHSELVP